MRSTSRGPSSTRARCRPKRGRQDGPEPGRPGPPGSKHHLLTDARGVPLAVSLTGGNRNDITQLIPLVDAVPPLRGHVGRPRRRPEVLVADRGYDHDSYRRQLRRRGIRPLIARRRTAHGSGLGRARWPVERSLSWLHQFRRLLVRFERRADIHEAFLTLACCLICFATTHRQQQMKRALSCTRRAASHSRYRRAATYGARA